MSCRSHALAAALVSIALVVPAAMRAGCGSVDAEGDIHPQFRFGLPSTAGDVMRVHEQIEHTSLTLCDATEGRMRPGSARLSVEEAPCRS